jgi:hypothetical protein
MPVLVAQIAVMQVLDARAPDFAQARERRSVR